MTLDQYEKLPPEEKEHFAICEECGEVLTDLLVRIGILKKDLDYHLIRASVFAEPLTSWEWPNGCLVRSCSWASGTRKWEFWERSVHVFPLLLPSRLSPSCRMAGLYLQGASLL
jgi:hypothetical protein